MTPVRIPGKAMSSKPLPWSRVSRYLDAKVKSSIGNWPCYQRSGDGSTLFITFKFTRYDTNVYQTVIFTREGITEMSSYFRVWYDDQSKPIFRLEHGEKSYKDDEAVSECHVRLDDGVYVFRNGMTIPYKDLSDIKGVVGADYVLLQFRKKAASAQRIHIMGTNYVTIEYPEKTAWIVADPENPRKSLVRLPVEFEPAAAFAAGSNLILFDDYRPQGERFKRRCLIYRRSGAGFRLAEEIPIPWMGHIFDLDAKSGVALIGAVNTRHKLPTYYQFNIKTRHRKLLGFVPADDILFLKDDVIRTLDRALSSEGK